MRIRALGHAGLELQGGDATLLCDPWFSPEGSFQASWFQYPENSHLLDADLFAPTAVLISHEHMDHVDPWFLARVPADVPVVVPRYPSEVLVRKILSAGPRQVNQLAPWEQFEICPGVRVFFVSEESPMNHDSAMVVRSGGHAILNMNDARLSPSQLRSIRAELGGTVDLLALQGAGASWYPICYEYEPQRMREVSRVKRLAKLAYVARVIKVVEPLMTLPFAGPPCFLDEELFQHNSEMGDLGIFPDQAQVIEWLVQEGIDTCQLLLPGDSWDAEGRVKEADSRWEDFSLADRDEYLAAYSERRRSHVAAVRGRFPDPGESLWGAFQEYFEHVLSMSPYFNEKVGMRVGFDIRGPGGGPFAVDFRQGREGTYRLLEDCQYIYRFDSRWLAPILDQTVPWEDFFLSLRFTAWRDPDLYSDHLLGLLKFAWPEALETVERYETLMRVEETIVVHSEGNSYRIQRYCPHAGQDLLETAEILPGGVIRCLGHHYEFDLETGECLTGVIKPLHSERIELDPPVRTSRDPDTGKG